MTDPSNHGDCACDHCLEEARINRELRAIDRERKATDPIGTAQERELIERARLEAKRESEVSRMMAQSKSLRQAGHEPPRDDLYMWSKPEETNTWKLADALQSRIAEVAELREALKPFAEACDDCVDDRDADQASIWEHPAAMQIEFRHLRAAAALSLQRRV